MSGGHRYSRREMQELEEGPQRLERELAKRGVGMQTGPAPEKVVMPDKMFFTLYAGSLNQALRAGSVPSQELVALSTTGDRWQYTTYWGGMDWYYEGLNRLPREPVCRAVWNEVPGLMQGVSHEDYSNINKFAQISDPGNAFTTIDGFAKDAIVTVKLCSAVDFRLGRLF